jgi:hypothetical protein
VAHDAPEVLVAERLLAPSRPDRPDGRFAVVSEHAQGEPTHEPGSVQACMAGHQTHATFAKVPSDASGRLQRDRHLLLARSRVVDTRPDHANTWKLVIVGLVFECAQGEHVNNAAKARSNRGSATLP